jgi:CRP-like cAMP-binding protein
VTIRVAEASVLAQVPLFAFLPADDLDTLVRCLRQRDYKKGETVFLLGDPGASLCIIESGRIKLGFTSPEGREIIFDLLGKGDFFGELAVLDGEPRSADAVAVEPSRIQHLQRDDFVQFLLDRPAVAVQLNAVLSRRLRRDAQLLQDATFLDVPARLARTILRLLEGESVENGNVPMTTPRLTQSDLAGMVGTTRETINKWLIFYEGQGFIRWEKGRLTVLSPEALRKRIY